MYFQTPPHEQDVAQGQFLSSDYIIMYKFFFHILFQ